MEQISIVRKRSRVGWILMALVIIALVIAAAVFFLGDSVTTGVGRALPLDGAVVSAGDDLAAVVRS